MSIRYLDDTPVEPIVFPNGISQDDVVRQVLASLESHDVVELESAPGTGKSHMAIKIITYYSDIGSSGSILDGRHRGILIEPINAISTQIHYDFTRRFKVYHYNKPVRIGTVFGRAHYMCPLIKDTADKAPCIGPRRKGIAVCNMYSPVVTQEEYELLYKNLGVAEAYNCVSGTCYKIRGSTTGCEYFDAHRAYLDSHIIITNPQKYKQHILAGVMPDFSIAVIDEADVALQALEPIYTTTFSEIKSFSSKHRVPRLADMVYNTFVNGADVIEVVNAHLGFWQSLYNVIINDIKQCIESCKNSTDECTLSCTQGKYEDLLYIKERIKLLTEMSSSSMMPKMVKSVKGYRRDAVITLVPGDMKRYFKQLFGNRKLVVMSATLPTDEEMTIYGFYNRAKLIAYRTLPGVVYVGFVSGFDRATKDVIKSPEYRLDFIKSLVETIKVAMAWKPVLVHVVAWDIWDDELLLAELERAGISPDAIDKTGRKVLELRDGLRDIVITSFATRGIDLYDDKLRAIVIPKAPYLPLDDPRVLVYKQMLGDVEFKRWYTKKMLDTTLQMIARGVRHSRDWVVVLSPDVRTLVAIKMLEQMDKLRAVWFKAPPPTNKSVQLDPSVVKCTDSECEFVKAPAVMQELNSVKAE